MQFLSSHLSPSPPPLLGCMWAQQKDSPRVALCRFFRALSSFFLPTFPSLALSSCLFGEEAFCQKLKYANNPPPTFLQRHTNIHNICWNRDCCTHTTATVNKQKKKKKIIYTHKCTKCRERADAWSAAARQHKTWSHVATSAPLPRAQSRWEKQKWQWGKETGQKWEKEMARREAGDDKWEELDGRMLMALKRGRVVSSALPLWMKSAILPSVSQTHTLILLKYSRLLQENT